MPHSFLQNKFSTGNGICNIFSAFRRENQIIRSMNNQSGAFIFSTPQDHTDKNPLPEAAG
jgi:hypothetical protein